jgi:MFS family permease
MLWRFSLYGFLKNQRYFEPFLVLAFLEKGLSFFMIGLLIASRELWVNLLEIPSGVVADLYGRRRSMMTSFVAYIVSFVIFGLARDPPLLFLAMACFAVGDAFRTGTHKAMIFAWLRREGRTEERTRVYGFTRSWSKLGSALSGVVAAVLVFVGGSYVWVFWLSTVPYLLGLVNFMGYPAWLDGERPARASVGAVARRLWSVLRASLAHRPLRRLLAESMGFEGCFHATKDYLQPLLQAAAVAWLGGLALTGLPGDDAVDAARRAALLVGPAYLLLHLLSAWASRRAHDLVDRAGGEEQAARVSWGLATALYAGLLAALLLGWHAVAIGAFLLLHVVQNLWRPVLISRFDSWGSERWGATVLSIENQAKSLATMLLAPALGLAVDAVSAGGTEQTLWPVGLLGLVLALGFLVWGRRGLGSPQELTID